MNIVVIVIATLLMFLYARYEINNFKTMNLMLENRLKRLEIEQKKLLKEKGE